MTKQYFQSTKRGEINDLREELISQDKEKRKDAVKKVIAAMSVGKDVSALFADVINCVQTNSIEVKKLVYLFVISYAKVQPELAILAINTFRKDSLDPNPLIRALAVRTMGYINLEAVIEYLVDPVRRCCRDADAYVRKTAAICVAKLYAIAPKMVEEQDFIEILQKELISDSNAFVVTNAAAALMEISTMSGRNCFDFKNFPDTLNSLLNALNESNEWGQSILLEAIALYRPIDTKESKMIVDRVSARLSHKNSAVVMAAVRVVISLLDRMGTAETVRSVCKKLTGPLITLIVESAEPEVQYIALRNVSIIVQKYPLILSGEIKVFFCRYNDPVYVKLEKLEAIIQLVNEKNADIVLSELKEYASEVDIDFVRRSVRCIGRCAIRVEAAADKCVNALLELIETKVSYVVQEAVVVMRDIFRRFPNRYEAVISALSENLESLDEPEAKAALIWILGEYADRIDNSADLIGSFIDNLLEEPLLVQMQLLTACVKHFLKVKQSKHATLVKVLQICTEQSENPDLRDRAYVYWRLLSVDPELCRKCIVGQKPLIVDDTQYIEPEILSKLIYQVGLIASVYHLDPNSFVRAKEPVVVADDGGPGLTDTMRPPVKSSAVERKENSTSESSDDQSDDDQSDDSSDDDGVSSSGSSDIPVVKKSVSSIPSLQTVKLNVLPVSAGKGVSIDASLGKMSGRPVMFVTIANKGVPSAVSQLAIQFNKNSFGLAPANGALDLGTPDQSLVPGASVDLVVPLEWNKLNSGAPPGPTLQVQVALRTNFEIFYFTVPFDLHVVFEPPGDAKISDLSRQWDALASSEQRAQKSFSGTSPDRIKSRMQQAGFVECLVAKNTLSFHATTCNKLVVMIQFADGSLIARSTNVHIVPHAIGLVQSLFS